MTKFFHAKSNADRKRIREIKREKNRERETEFAENKREEGEKEGKRKQSSWPIGELALWKSLI